MIRIKRFFENLFIANRLFLVLGILAILFINGYSFSFLFPVAQTALVVFAAVILVDIILLYNPNIVIHCNRKLPKVFSLGDNNKVRINLDNKFTMPLKVNLIDELPIQFQKRDFEMEFLLSAGEKKEVSYTLRPVERGNYIFQDIHLFLQSPLGLIQRRIKYKLREEVPVYPSIIQMKQFELNAFTQIATFKGIKKVRRLGHSYEFEQIRNYVKGDDYRSVNWKATSRQNKLMVNQYQDERSQQVFTVIDKSRSMKMPFNDMSLMDYAINTSLVISNIALKKYDRAGLLTFSDKIGTTLKADNSPAQLRRIMDALYNEKERPMEANYELLFAATRKFISRRSLLFLYTNFESYYAMLRVLPILRRINRMHLLVVVFFENTEIVDYSKQSSKNVEEIYHQTIAQKFVHEKMKIVQELKQYGIQAILTRPEDLSINTINKYLQLKSRGLI